MHTKIELPRAFSVRDEHEFLPIQHLMTRLNPNLLVEEVATGVHVDGGGTVHWGLVYLNGEPPSKQKVETALREAGFDFAHNVLTQAAFVLTDHSRTDAVRSYVKTLVIGGILSLPFLGFATNAAGEMGSPGEAHPFGPYIAEMPANPFDGSNKVTAVAAPGQEPTGVVGSLGGWQYDASNGLVWPNNAEYYR